jgi:DNA-binding MarR family transcriptional regulator
MSTGIRRLNAELFRQARILHMLKARLSAESAAGLDSGALGVLIHVVKSGGIRQRELAECAMLDPSTVSRHVALLVRVGHVERQPDPDDGRAVRLVATPTGVAMHEQLVSRRESLMREVLSHWSEQDLDDLTSRLRRLNDDIEACRPQTGLPFRHPVPRSAPAQSAPAQSSPAPSSPAPSSPAPSSPAHSPAASIDRDLTPIDLEH